MPAALASENGEDESIEILELVAALDAHTAQFGAHHLQTIAVANRLAIAFWHAGEIDRAVGLLDQALERLDAPTQDDGIRIDLLCTLGDIMAEQSQWERASVIYREVLELCILRSGESHPSSLAAMGDLAVVLFELEDNDEAERLEGQAWERARVHLDKTHPVRCVLAWNRALRYEKCEEPEFARSVITTELAWLLTEDESQLNDDQLAIRTMVARRFNWDEARVC
jgi:tetratricopeptide (TPR) repeat protein